MNRHFLSRVDICATYAAYERTFHHSNFGHCVCILAIDPAQNAIQGDAPEGSDTFQWQLGEEIAWAEIG